jgi:hypothetical protein
MVPQHLLAPQAPEQHNPRAARIDYFANDVVVRHTDSMESTADVDR